ncbi:MAG: hypothetical protein WBQ73_00030 [Candidatus Babeliales bacterium]
MDTRASGVNGTGIDIPSIVSNAPYGSKFILNDHKTIHVHDAGSQLSLKNQLTNAFVFGVVGGMASAVGQQLGQLCFVGLAQAFIPFFNGKQAYEQLVRQVQGCSAILQALNTINDSEVKAQNVRCYVNNIQYLGISIEENFSQLDLQQQLGVVDVYCKLVDSILLLNVVGADDLVKELKKNYYYPLVTQSNRELGSLVIVPSISSAYDKNKLFSTDTIQVKEQPKYSAYPSLPPVRVVPDDEDDEDN